ncbi:MAG TPA: cellulose biosynthesis cyclic di-GMP-binding regulatory protein BcsB [Usitatibacter sp.]|nr:cellulose biosynthesis cyclic di-GMP-binding regulatory protein BcsB [Usitatibacter sp.]
MQRGLASFALIVLVLVFASPARAEPEALRRTPFTSYGAPKAIDLEGDGASAHVDFGTRGDEIAIRGAFRLRYALSPGLAPGLSRLRLMLNDQPIGTIPASADASGERVVEFDPRLIVGYNRLSITLEAAPGAGAEDRPPSALWAQVLGSSELELTLRPLALGDELATLPEPFFDRHDERRVTVPFVFSAQPSHATLEAAAVVASWLGLQARWRGTRFPVALGEPVPGHAIAFVAGAERPAFLEALAPVTGPTLRITTNPADGHSKLLLVMGRDSGELALAARALALGKTKLSGASATLKAFEEPAARAAWDAPAFVRIDRPMRLSELVEGAEGLQAIAGPAPAPVRIDLRLPPELASGSVPLGLDLKYTAPRCAVEGRLEISLDDELIEVLPLPVGREAMQPTLETWLPASRMPPRTRITLDPRFTMKDEPACRDAREATPVQFSPQSTFDFSGLAVRGRLPDLAGFARLGTPFTRHADLSGTAIVLPAAPVPAEIETMLALVGRMGEATGVPATRVRVAGASDEKALAGSDLLVIGAAERQPLLQRWARSLPADPPGRSRRPLPVAFEGAGPLAMVMGFESPLSPGRSVVAVTSVAASQLPRVLDALDDRERRRAFGGSVSYVMEDKVESAFIGRTYTTRFVASLDGLREWLLARPALLAGIAGLAAALVGMGAWRFARFWRAAGRGGSA